MAGGVLAHSPPLPLDQHSASGPAKNHTSWAIATPRRPTWAVRSWLTRIFTLVILLGSAVPLRGSGLMTQISGACLPPGSARRGKDYATLAVDVLTLAALGAVTFNPALAVTDGKLDGNGHSAVVLLLMEVNGAPAFRCSGTLLSPTVLLTAGHCTNNFPGSPTRV